MMNGLLEIKLPKCTVFLTASEMNTLLASNPAIWKESLKRGKHVLRSRKKAEREAKNRVGGAGYE